MLRDVVQESYALNKLGYNGKNETFHMVVYIFRSNMQI